MELNQEMLNELKAESAELVERFARIWMVINTSFEQGQAASRTDIDELFRCLHSLKGLSEIADQPRLVSALHLIEDRLTQIREGASVLNAKDLEVLAEAQLLLEKIFLTPAGLSDDVLLADLEFQAQCFCVGSLDESPSQTAAAGHVDELTSQELEAWEKYRTREEFIFALMISGSTDEYKSRILPVGEILIERCTADQSLLVFTAELDQSLIEAIVEAPVRLLQKDPSPLKALGSLWTGLVEKSSSLSRSDQAVNLSSGKEPAQTQQSVGTDHAYMHAGGSAQADPDKRSADLDEFSGHELSQIDVVHDEQASASASNQIEAADPEMVRDFLGNARELLESLTQSLLELETNPSASETIENIFRAAHTIKGTAGMLGFSTIERLCHALENTFDRIRKGQLTPTPVLIDQLLVGWDKVRELFELLEHGKNPDLPIDVFLRQLVAAENGVQSTEREKPKPKTTETSDQEAASKQISAKTETNPTIRVDLKRLDILVNLVGELVIDRTRFARIEEAMRSRGASADLSHQMAESVLLFGRHMNEVQNIIMKVRMVPVGNVFYKFSRMVRDLSRQVGKDVELSILGGETELDKTLVEEIGDPLVHLIRNSIDHGIEAPEDRQKVGKPAKGNVRLTASQQGNVIVISVEDDGKGLDVERIRAKAIKNGLIRENDPISTKDIFNLIFEPGFSTAEKVTNISGRGVGMDVVKKNIQKLKGIIELDSTPGHGTKTIIKLPITLAIVPSLMVEVSGENFAIPLANVIESIRIDPSEIQQMGTSQFVRLREQVVPIVRFSEVLGLTGLESDFWYREKKHQSTLRHRRERLVFVVLGIGPERIGLVVDRLIGQQEIVIKPLGALLRQQTAFAGGCVLGDGRVALVLDVLDVFGQDAIQRGLHARRAS